MGFVWKFFKALNSAQTPFQITFALALGMVMGLTPVSGIQTVVILLLAFVLNIHLGLFFLSAAFFAGVGYLADPWFESIGYALLTSESLQGFWTALYNNAAARLSYFNNTVVLGSTVVAVVLAVPMIVVLNLLIRLYREQLQGLLMKYPAFGRFGLLSVSEQSLPTLRWWGSGAFAAVGGVVAVIAMLLADPLFKWSLEKGMSNLLDRPVSVASATVHFPDFALEVKRLEIASEEAGKNAFSADTIRLDPDLAALLQHQVHVKQLHIGGIGFDTPSQNPMPPAAAEETSDTSEGKEQKASASALTSFEIPSAESLLEKADLKSLKLYDETQAEIDAISAKWQKIADDELGPRALDALQKDFDALQGKAQSKDPQQLLALKDDVTAFTDKIDARQKRIASLQKEFAADQKRVEQLLAKAKAAPQEDFERLKSAYALGGSGTMNIVGALFGEKIKGYLQTAQKYYTMAAPYLSSDGGKETPPPPRGEGRWIKFAADKPALWIGETALDGMLNAQAFGGKIRDVSDNQKLLGRPITLDVKSDGQRVRGLALQAEINRLGEQPVDSLMLRTERYVLAGADMSVVKLESSDMAFSADMKLVDLHQLDGSADIGFSRAVLHASGQEGEIAAAVERALRKVSGFNVKAGLSGSIDAPEISVQSDLDKKLTAAVQSVASEEIAAQEKRLKALLNEKTSGQLAALGQSQGGIPDIGALAGKQDKTLEGLSGDAAGLLTSQGGGALKGVLPF